MDYLDQNTTQVAIHHGAKVLAPRYFQYLKAFFMQALQLTMIAKSSMAYIKPFKYMALDAHTTVRIYAGSHPVSGEKWNLKGNVPDVALFAESGKWIGQAFGYGQTLAEGAFFDIMVPHSPIIQTARPHYLNLIAGGDDALCVAGIEVTYPDGEGVSITGDILKKCAFRTEAKSPSGKHLEGVNLQSKTQMGYDHNPPACFWLDRNKSLDHLWMTALSLRIPDFAPTAEKRDEWNQHPERLCSPSPRLYYHEGRVNVFSGIPIWMPPFESHPNGTDKDPNRVVNWVGAKHNHFHSHPGRSTPWSNTTGEEEPAVVRPVDKSVPGQPRRLVISHHTDFSAREKCLVGDNTGADYVSVPEEIYCDMKSRNMWHLCRGSFIAGCFDDEQLVLRGFEDDRNGAHIVDPNATATATANIEIGVSTQGNSTNAKRDAAGRLVPPNLPQVIVTDHDGPAYGMRYSTIKVLK